jgi:hypothetical protein
LKICLVLPQELRGRIAVKIPLAFNYIDRCVARVEMVDCTPLLIL